MSRYIVARANVFALLAVLLLAGVFAGLAWDRVLASRAARTQVDHAYRVMVAVKEVGAAIRDAETGQRGFLLTGEDTYLAPYQAALGRIALLQGELQRLIAGNPSQRAHVATLAPLVSRKLEELAQTIELRRRMGSGSALDMVRSGLGRQLMVDIETELDGMSAEEDRLLNARLAELSGNERVANWLAGGVVLAALLLVAHAVRILGRSLHRQHASESRQRELAEQLRATLDSLSQGIGVFNAGYRLERWNHCFMELLDLPQAMMREGTPYLAVAAHLQEAAGDDFLESEAQIRHGDATRDPIVYERVLGKHGHVLELRRTPLPGGNGGFVLTVTDMTRRAQADAVLRESQKMQAIGHLTGGIAHDFNNLLSVILGNLELARPRLPADSPVAPRLDRATWAAQRGAVLTRQLLAFARRQPLEPRPVDVAALLPELATMLRRTLGEPIDVRVVEGAGLWLAMADATQIESAVLNLALNARDAMPSGGRLTIETANKVLDEAYADAHAEVAAGEYVMIAVSDTGSGMTPEVLSRAFEPFFTTKGTGGGTGLGLAQVYGFIKQSGGHIKIYSEPGEGTTVRLYLPIAAGKVAAPRGSAPVELPRGSATILVCEDDAAVREVAVAILRDLGYRVLEAADGEQALRVFGDNAASVNLVLADVVMPGKLRGRDVVERIQAMRPQVRAVYMSGYTENAVMHQGRLDEGVILVSKPFKREQLARKVAEALGQPAGPAGDEDKVVDLSRRRE